MGAVTRQPLRPVRGDRVGVFDVVAHVVGRQQDPHGRVVGAGGAHPVGADRQHPPLAAVAQHPARAVDQLVVVAAGPDRFAHRHLHPPEGAHLRGLAGGGLLGDDELMGGRGGRGPLRVGGA